MSCRSWSPTCFWWLSQSRQSSFLRLALYYSKKDFVVLSYGGSVASHLSAASYHMRMANKIHLIFPKCKFPLVQTESSPSSLVFVIEKMPVKDGHASDYRFCEVHDNVDNAAPFSVRI